MVNPLATNFSHLLLRPLFTREYGWYPYKAEKIKEAKLIDREKVNQIKARIIALELYCIF